MGRFAFDVYVRKEETIMPINFVIRKKQGKRKDQEVCDEFIATIEGNSYDEAINTFIDMLKKGIGEIES